MTEQSTAEVASSHSPSSRSASNPGEEPLEDSRAQSLYKLIYALRAEKKIRVGFNEALKSVQNGSAHLVVYATDAVPSAIVAPLPVVCEQRGVQCVAVSSRSALGKACRVDVDVIACSVSTDKHENPSRILEQIKVALK